MPIEKKSPFVKYVDQNSSIPPTLSVNMNLLISKYPDMKEHLDFNLSHQLHLTQ